MPLDPQAGALLDLQAAARFPGFHRMPVAEARAAFLARRNMSGRPEPVAQVADRELPGGLAVRIYTPATSTPIPRPALVYFHGGGWVMGDLETADAPCRAVANRGDCVVVSVAYRLAPEHKFPCAVEDAYQATCWVAEQAEALQIDPNRLAVGGDSAGGNLATVTALIARDQGHPPLAFQLLVYPVTDFAFDTPSYHQCAEGYGLTLDAMRYYWSQYLDRPEAGAHPHASPLRADLRGLPPALIFTAECDPIRDDGEAYAARLQAQGVPVRLHRYEGQIHGFFLMAGIMNASRAAIDEAGAALRAALHPEVQSLNGS